MEEQGRKDMGNTIGFIGVILSIIIASIMLNNSGTHVEHTGQTGTIDRCLEYS